MIDILRIMDEASKIARSEVSISISGKLNIKISFAWACNNERMSFTYEVGRFEIMAAKFDYSSAVINAFEVAFRSAS